jgi:hypothetical protein
MHQLVVTALIVTVMFALARDTAQPGSGDWREQVLRPIIAQLYATPGDFSGRSIAIYGVVVESGSRGAEFMLQDVSQHPLKIVGHANLIAAVGDQVMIVGIFHDDPHAPYLAATAVLPTKVLAGGGCC